ncbi:MAG: CBS domain-containing protein [Blastochloris sp.]|nr:CBS domain-containing protein [Blastochloris sp.]
MMPQRFTKFCLDSHETLRRALEVIDLGVRALPLVDGEHRLVGTLTDGDVRRALLKNASLDEAARDHAKTTFTTVSSEASRAEVLDLMQSRILHQVPILDRQGRLAGLHLLHEILGAIERPNWALIMAGGRGTRLGALTDEVPKPMLKVVGRPILERLIHHFVGFGIRRIFISVHYLGHVIEDYFGDGSKFGCQIDYLREVEPLGTGGSLRLLPEVPAHPLLVCNGDLVTQVDFGSLLTFHEQGGYLATMGVRSYSHHIPYGCVEIQDGQIARLQEKPSVEHWVNAGIYALSPEILRRVPEGFFPITDLFEACLERQEKVGAFEVLDDWIDVGQREHLRQARGGR